MFQINTNKYNDKLSEDFTGYLKDILTGNFSGQDAGILGKQYLQQNLTNTIIETESINDISMTEIIDALYNNIDIIKNIDTNGIISYEVGWFTPELANYATLLEYGSQMDTNYIQAKYNITRILLSQESDSFADICTQQISNRISLILNKLEVK